MALVPAHRKLREWVSLDPEHRTGTTVAAALRVRQPSASGWLTGKSRPDAHLRPALEILTEGFVKAVDWLTPNEMRLLRFVKPMRAPSPRA